MMGPGRRRGAPMPPMSIKGQGKLLLRVLKFIMRNYGLRFLIVLGCIFVTARCTLQGTMFTKELIDVHIKGILAGTSTFEALGARLIRLAIVLAIGVASSYLQQRIMVVITQGSMLKIRNELFTKMEELPIKYFDTHSHGDIMSVYTNDVDTLRQLIGQTLPQVFNSVITIVTTFVSMVAMSFPLTLLSLVLIALSMKFSMKIAGNAGKYFGDQQKNIGAINGYIEEMMEGQKVVKVFCYEDKALDRFRELNENLRFSANTVTLVCQDLSPPAYRM